MLFISSLGTCLAILFLSTDLVLSSPVALEVIKPLTKRDRRAPGAHCPGGLYSTDALNLFLPENTAEYRVCCPERTPDAVMVVNELVCCVHNTDPDHPEGCSVAAGTFVYPASVKGCDKGWKKHELSGIKFCQRDN